MACLEQTSTAAPPRPCEQCGKPEHGSVGCAVATDWPVEAQFWAASRPCPYCACSIDVVYDFGHVIHLVRPLRKVLG